MNEIEELIPDVLVFLEIQRVKNKNIIDEFLLEEKEAVLRQHIKKLEHVLTRLTMRRELADSQAEMEEFKEDDIYFSYDEGIVGFVTILKNVSAKWDCMSDFRKELALSWILDHLVYIVVTKTLRNFDFSKVMEVTYDV